MKTILIIEDEAPLREEVAEWLIFEGYRVFQAEDGTKGMQLASALKPDIIFCDIMMPGIGGFDLVKELRKLPETSTIPVVLMSALSERQNVREGMGAGANDYLTKPFTRAELLETLYARLKETKLHTEASQELLKDLRYKILSTLPHELKTPLHGIIGFGEMLQETPGDYTLDDLREIGSSIKLSGMRLSRLVQNYLTFLTLEFSTPSSWGVQLLNGFDIYQTIIDEAHRVMPCYGRITDLVIDTAESNLQISAEFFKKIIFELFDNACKFSSPGTPVTIEGKIIDHHFYQIDFCDTGRGMFPSQIESIGAFVQFDRNHYEQQGLGLGLALVIKMTELSGGKVRIISEPGKGTCIEIKLKRANI
jgi:signal transduction histidine kinase